MASLHGMAEKGFVVVLQYIVGCRGASQLGDSLLGIPPGYKANKL